MSSPEAEAVQPFEPLVTERLIIRAPVREDLDSLATRRNDPEVARFQDWQIPYSAEQAIKRLDGSIEQGGLANEEWWMATVVLRDGGTPIGDMAINISWNWRVSEVGYSFSPEFWGQGYAAEALDAVLNHLFEDRDIQRVSASLAPENTASALLLERAGFSFEGQTMLSYWEGDAPDAESGDTGFYGLTRADRNAWLARPTGPAGAVELVDITNENRREVAQLVTHKSQERLVAPIIESFADALFTDRPGGRTIEPRMWAIEADGELAGFVMIAKQNEHNPEPYLWRLNIDRRFQRRSIGGSVVEQIEQYCRSKGATAIRVQWGEGKGSPGPFYLARNYAPTGNMPDNEVEAIKQL